ncbi:scavenger receptor cysteine-rich domain superfamily protein-like [Dreissena polymorpha]|uniref:scavenger receptor cysteine-rich domain superfamily protein-like n=1 Tax=Dreissena polymorpha TaxID=45954 RepID=UPI0022646DFF|nr:scavenger receptor cysteine-rich domain superfamily protein-like [Dreissena polymorpha]
MNGIYGSVCDSNFDYDSAEVVCKALNSSLHAAVYFTGAKFGEGSGPIHVDQLHCEVNDTTLDQCKYVKRDQCSHSRDVSVLCNECGLPDIAYWGVDYFNFNGTSLYANCEYYKSYIGYLQMVCTGSRWQTIGECQEYTRPLHIQDIKLVGGMNASDGRVEMKVFDTWGTICSDSFGFEEANVICSMIGYYPAITFYTTLSGGSGPIFVDNMVCAHDAYHINECQYDTFDNCDHNRDVGVTCTDCGDPNPFHGHANDTKSNVGTVVSVSCDLGYLLNGDSVITCLQNGKWSGSPSCIFIGNVMN